MAHAPFRAEVLTPDGALFAGEVEQVSTRTVAGEIGILARHSPLLGRLEPAELKLTEPGGDVTRYVQTGGYVQIAADGNVLLLAEEAYPVDEYSKSDAQARLDDAEERLGRAEAGTEAHRIATIAHRRAKALVALGDRL
ncbi:MAG: ATP synthase F1 subunit epsilon [Solirubrobacteraceae bacterium]|nr:ATP synthase F1 subunit epsilon [Solirubrobacteraceae bacterium]